MWKLVLGFVAFAAVALFVIVKGGDSLDLSGEKHDTASHTATSQAAPAAPSAEVAKKP